MTLPYFYVAQFAGDTLQLDEETSKHIVGVLRMKMNQELLLTDGKGKKALAFITDDNRKRCIVRIRNTEYVHIKEPRVAIGISLIKNSSRFEWFLEKATEIGVHSIYPLICARTEKEKFRFDRMHQILISALIQSQQCWLPVLSEPVELENFIQQKQFENRLIAHCMPEKKSSLNDIDRSKDTLILIGPEGDFTENEINQSLQKGFFPVTLGTTRLRSETAGIVAAALLCCQND